MLPDTVLGHYRILSPLGKGGMGEVYAAEDTKLHRTVALKILPLAAAADPDRRKRFEREAQAVAALNHPNIVTIYSVEEASGVLFLTMEAVEGRTLKEMVPEGGLPLDVLLRVGMAVGDAMAAAHQRGITHRDLKPGNVMVTADGRVKVLDFGLAKLREAGREAEGEQATTLRGEDLTGEGRIIGTVAYMSPEQAEGKPVDRRSDIFSLGVMLHEMATGERPFKGDTDISVISSILKETPSSITDVKPALPPGLARIVRRALAKDPARRYQTATDVRNDLEELKQDLDSGIVTTTSVRPAPARQRLPIKWIAIGTVALLAIVAAGLFVWMRAGGGTASSQAATFTPDRFTRLTDSGAAYLAALSSDGRYVVHVKTENALPGVWVRQTATTSDVRIVPPTDVRCDGVAFSADGNYVYYVTYPPGRGVGSLYKIPALGGAPIRLLEDIDSAPAFSPDGRTFAFVRGEVARGVRHLMIANADGTGAHSLAAPSAGMKFLNETPAWSPDGRTILVPASESALKYGMFAVDAATGATSQIGGTWLFTRNVRWMPDGRSFVMDGVDRLATPQSQLWQVTYPSGERRRITNDLNGYVGVSLSADGRMLATVQGTTEAKIWIVPAVSERSESKRPPDGGEAKEVPIAAGRAVATNGLAWTPDGRLVFTAQSGGFLQVWIAGADGSDARPLTSGEAVANAPVVSPDGRWIYYVFAADTVSIWRMGIDGSDQRALTTGAEASRPIVSPDSQWVYFTIAVNGQNRAMRMKADGSNPSPISDAVFAPMDIAPDGTELLGIAWNQEKQRSECAVLPVNGGAVRLLGDLGATGGALAGTCRWAPGGTSISYVASREGRMNVFARPVAGGEERQITHFPRDATPQMYGGSWSRDGRVAISRGTSPTDVVLISAK